MANSNSPIQPSDLLLRLQSVIDTAIDGIITINTMGLIESINPSAATLFGYETEEVSGQNISMLMPNPDRRQHDGYIRRYLDTGEARIIGVGREVTGLKKDGTSFPFRLAVSKVELAGHIIFTGIIHDLTQVRNAEEKMRRLNEELEGKVHQRTNELADSVDKLLATNQRLKHEVVERKKAEQALRQSLEKEKELSELKSRFVSMASHEFRTPLSSILSSAELIGEYRQAEQQPKREKHVQRILKSVRHLTGILNDFLSLSKLEEGAVRVQPSTFDLASFCTEALDEISASLKDEQRIVHLGEWPEQEVFLDARLLRIILVNLLSNAAKYSPAGATIHCTVGVVNNRVLLEVTDQGIGIPAEDQPHLFSRFFRARNAENIQGTGLGLHIVQRYVKLQSGNIIFTSKEGVGTTFKVSLPTKLAL